MAVSKGPQQRVLAGDSSTDEERAFLPLKRQLNEDGSAVDEDQLFRKLNWRILPIFWLMVVFNYIDRTNLAFAAIQLKADLGFTGKVYGLGSGLFFVTYATLQIPSNILLRRIGGPTWLAAIVAGWGLCAVSFAFMQNRTQFYILRTLLGVAEAGAFPGTWYMMSKFYPQERITVAFAIVESGIAVSNALAAPIAAGLLSLNGLMGWPGWRWLFLLEGIPSLCLALAILRFLPASPEKATVLTPAERAYLLRRIARDQPSDTHSISSTHDAVGSLRGTATPGVNTMTRKASRARVLLQAPLTSHSLSHACDKEAATLDSEDDGSVDVLVQGSQPAAQGPHLFAMCTWLTPDIRLALSAAVANKYVWYMGFTKLVRDIAGNGILFFAPLIIDALISGRAFSLHVTPPKRVKPRGKISSSSRGGSSSSSSSKGHRALLGLLHNTWQGLSRVADGSTDDAGSLSTSMQETAVSHDIGSWRSRSLLGGPVVASSEAGILPALLTSLPFGLAAATGLYIAHRSQLKDERILHTGLPLLVSGLIYQCFPYLSIASTLAGFCCLCVGVVGVNCVGPPILAMISEVAAGPGLVVALPLFNSIGNVGGFLGPFVIGWLLDATSSFAMPSVLTGWCLALSGVLILAMPRVLGFQDRSSSSQALKPK